MGNDVITQHYQDFLRASQQVDWLEIISDNYLVDGGKPLVLLDQIRAHYPIVMHGIAMSIGESQRVDDAYLQRVKALADRLQPLGISDHLCGIGSGPDVAARVVGGWVSHGGVRRI